MNEINYDPKKWVTLSEAARIRKVTRQSMSYLVKKDHFETLRIGTNVFVVREDVQKYMPDPGGRPKKKKSAEK